MVAANARAAVTAAERGTRCTSRHQGLFGGLFCMILASSAFLTSTGCYFLDSNSPMHSVHCGLQRHSGSKASADALDVRAYSCSQLAAASRCPSATWAAAAACIAERQVGRTFRAA